MTETPAFPSCRIEPLNTATWPAFEALVERHNGIRRLYERLGFTYDRPKGLKNCVMITTVEAA